LLIAPEAMATKEAGVYQQQHYNGSTCDATDGYPGNLIYAGDMADNWHDEIDAWSSFDANLVLYDEYPEGEDLEDSDVSTYGTDFQTGEGVEYFDVAYVIAHGSYSCGSPYYVELGFTDTVHTDCRPRTSGMQFGDGDLDIFYTSACNSAQHCVFTNGGFGGLDAGNFNLWGGFHGINTDGPGIPGSVTDFVSGTRYSGAGSHWLAEMNHIRLGSDNDDCAIAIVEADNGTDADNYYDNAGIDDYAISTGSHTHRYYYSISGCDPDDGDAL